MNYEFEQSPFSRAVLTSVFVGFVATIICLIYNIIFRESTGYKPADFINVSSLIFAVNIVFFVIGMIFFAFHKNGKKGDLLFGVLFAVLTLVCIWLASGATMMHDRVLSSEFRTLLIGVIAIIGIGAAFFVPYLFNHKKFTDAVI